MGPKRETTDPADFPPLVRSARARRRSIMIIATAAGILAAGVIALAPLAMAKDGNERGDSRLDKQLQARLQRAGFTGAIESKLVTPKFLGRQVDPSLADLGRRLFFDTSIALHGDNACAGCHSPAVGFGDTQSIAIGVGNNGVVGPDRTGARNQRRSPLVLNTAFYPKLMWNGRFSAPSGNPFDNSQGFDFPPPEGKATDASSKFPPGDPTVEYLLVAQAHIPSTELVEMAGFTGTKGTIGVRFDQFDDGRGRSVPPPDGSGFRNEPIRQKVLGVLNDTRAYVGLFRKSFPDEFTSKGKRIDFTMVGRAIAEFEFTLVRANAPIDRYARGDLSAMTDSQKRGALLFFGKGDCVACHAVAGASNEMFSDFAMHNIGVPQIAPKFGVGKGNVVFDGPREDQDFGLEQITGDPADRYKFRSSPLRNVALQPTFFHNGAFTRLEDAIRHHLNVRESAVNYGARKAGVDADLTLIQARTDLVLRSLDPLVATPMRLTDREFDDLVAFVRDGLLDPRATSESSCDLIPGSVPSGRPMLLFEGC